METKKAKNLRKSNADRLEVAAVKEPKKPMLDNKDMVAFLCIICAALMTYIFFDKSKVIIGSRIQLAFLVVVQIGYIALFLYWTTQKIVRTCYFRAKRKAQDN